VGLVEGGSVMSELHRMTATQARALLAKGSISAEELVRSCLARIEAREPNVAAWQYLDPALAIGQARAVDSLAADARASRPIAGIPVGIKDICDTADMPTAYGSRARLGHRPAIDATCVAHTRAAGGIVMGKTVTTEFAGRYPGVTSNPHDPRRTPGGSSSGSAAAVADFMVPLAIGTQTGGSVLRPASYCGVFGYKPTFGHLSFEGIHHGAESFDTLGCMARSLDDIRLYRDVLMGFATPAAAPPAIGKPLRIGFCKTSKWDEADKATRDLLEGAASRLAAAGAAVSEFVLPAEFDEIYELAGKLFAVEYARAITPELLQSPENLSGAVMTMVRDAARIAPETYMAGLARVDALRVAANAVLDDYDIVLTPSAGGEAPMTHDSTGPVTFTIVWQVLSLPSLTMPACKGPNGLPVGVQLVGKRHKDVELLAMADSVWRELGGEA
jgi:Asp-tRNA(Asn)/Glu-tRNA(Gln) amidotransferase A subunit family amidase